MIRVRLTSGLSCDRSWKGVGASSLCPGLNAVVTPWPAAGLASSSVCDGKMKNPSA